MLSSLLIAAETRSPDIHHVLWPARLPPNAWHGCLGIVGRNLGRGGSELRIIRGLHVRLRPLGLENAHAALGIIGGPPGGCPPCGGACGRICWPICMFCEFCIIMRWRLLRSAEGLEAPGG